MKENKWEKRERKQHKAKNGMKTDGSSLKMLWKVINDKSKKSRETK